MAWTDDLSRLKGAGFSDAEIAAEGDRQRQQLAGGGFTPGEIDAHFGIKEPDLSPLTDLFKYNLETKKTERVAEASDGKEPQEIADGFIDAIEHGFGQSSGGMMINAVQGKRVTPEMLMPEDAGTFMRIASQVGTIAGDLPAMVAGSVIGAAGGIAAGSAVGSAVPVVGTVAGGVTGGVLGAGAGGNALPEAIRQSLVQYYEKGEIQDFGDFWERTSAAFIETSKQAVIGAATVGVGGKVLQSAGKVMAPQAARIASIGSEIATMVAVGKTFEGEVPKAQDFLDAALLVGGLTAATKTAGKLRQIYAKTGQHPATAAQEATTNPAVKESLLSNGDEIPAAYQSLETGSVQIKQLPEPIPDAPSTAAEKILSRIGKKAEKAKKNLTREQVYTAVVDKFHPIKKAMEALHNGESIPAIADAYKLARLAVDASSKALHFFENGTLDFKTLKINGKSLSEILKPFANEMSELKAFMLSKRALELEGRGIEHGFDVDAAKEVVKAGEVKYGTAAKEISDFQTRTLQYLRDAGVLSAETFKRIKDASDNYVSLKRISEEGTTSGTSKKNPVKKILGSDKQIQDPFVSIIENTHAFIKMAETNRAKVALVNKALSVDGQTLIEKVKGAQREIRISGEEATRALENQGAIVTRDSIRRDLKAKGFKVTDEMVEKAFENENLSGGVDAFSIFRPADRPLAKNEFDVYRDGKREVYATEQGLAEAINLLDGSEASQNMAVNLVRSVTAVKRFAISMTPDFQIRNFLRDQMTAGVLTQGGMTPFWHSFQAMGDIISKNDHFYNWQKSGGANGAFLDMEARYLKDGNYVFDIAKETNFLEKVRNVVKSPVESLKFVGTLMEESTRLAEFKSVTKGQTSGAAIFEAGYAAREVTVDFQRHGAKIAAWNSITAFQNASIQGLDRVSRAFVENPTAMMTKSLALITAPSMLLWWVNKDDQRLDEIPQYQKDLFWLIAFDDWQPEISGGEHSNLPEHLVRTNEKGQIEINRGNIHRIPKPLELGVLFGSVPERMMDLFFKDNPDALREFGKTMANFIPGNLPDVAVPIFEQAVNKNFFTGNKVVAGHLEGILPHEQYTDYTSQTARALGKLIAPVPGLGRLGPKDAALSSPMVLDNYVRSWGGTWGQYAIQIIDAGLVKAGAAPEPAPAPTKSLAELPFAKAFTVKFPSAQAESIQSFYEEAEENAEIAKTIKFLVKRGDLDEAQKIAFDEDNAGKMANLNGYREAIKNQNYMVMNIRRDPLMSPDEKAQLIDGLLYGMINIAKAGKEMNREFKKSIEEQKKAAGE